jgi:hypothetical protein
MEEATGAPSSLADWDPKRLRASSRDGETVMTESPSPLTMLLSRHTKRREFITLLGGAGSRMAARGARACGELALREPIPASRIALLRKALLPPTSDIPFTFSPPQGSRWWA